MSRWKKLAWNFRKDVLFIHKGEKGRGRDPFHPTLVLGAWHGHDQQFSCSWKMCFDNFMCISKMLFLPLKGTYVKPRFRIVRGAYQRALAFFQEKDKVKDSVVKSGGNSSKSKPPTSTKSTSHWVQLLRLVYVKMQVASWKTAGMSIHCEFGRIFQRFKIYMSTLQRPRLDWDLGVEEITSLLCVCVSKPRENGGIFSKKTWRWTQLHKSSLTERKASTAVKIAWLAGKLTV